MKKQEVIDELTKTQEKFYEVWMNLDLDKSSRDTAINVYTGIMIAKTYVDRLDEPQAEKVEVPDSVAELICKYKAKKETLVCSIANLYRESDEYKWYVDNAEIYERAWANGYTVEQPKRWVVRQGGSEVWYLQGFRNSLDGDIVKQWCSHEGCIKFTDRAKAEAVATLVEGSVEEV